jgi:hypothetical protein
VKTLPSVKRRRVIASSRLIELLPVGKRMPARRARRFRAFCVGLPKTGTTSVGTIFENYRSAKVAGSSLERLGCDVREDSRAAEAARAFVLRRDAEEWLEMDPSSANWMILGVLKEQFPDSRFILTIRDCYSWCDSMLNVLIGRTAANDFVESPELFKRMLGCELDWFRDAETALRHSEPILEKLLEFWAQQAKTALECPSDRTLVIRTSEISSSLKVMADFVGVPPETLLPERTHSRQTDRKFDILRRIDRHALEAAFGRHADSDFMRAYFPEATLGDFLISRTRAPTRSSQTAAVRATIDGPDEALEAMGRVAVERAMGHQEIAEALAVIRAHSARGVPQRLGYRLEKYGLRVKDARCYAVLQFVGARGALILELGLRDALGHHWLASERFSISYRRSAPATVQSDQQLAQTLLDAVEHHVRRSEADGRIHERE